MAFIAILICVHTGFLVAALPRSCRLAHSLYTGSLGLLNRELSSKSLFSSEQLTYFHTVAGILTQGLHSHL
jgi:hypothetical protein